MDVLPFCLTCVVVGATTAIAASPWSAQAQTPGPERARFALMISTATAVPTTALTAQADASGANERVLKLALARAVGDEARVDPLGASPAGVKRVPATQPAAPDPKQRRRRRVAIGVGVSLLVAGAAMGIVMGAAAASLSRSW